MLSLWNAIRRFVAALNGLSATIETANDDLRGRLGYEPALIEDRTEGAEPEGQAGENGKARRAKARA